MIEDNETVTLDEAVALLPDREQIHTFTNPTGGLLIGADWERSRILEALQAAPEIYRTGPAAMSSGHGLAVDEDGRMVFIETAGGES